MAGLKDVPDSHGPLGTTCCEECLNLVMAIDVLQCELNDRLECFRNLRLGTKAEAVLEMHVTEFGRGPVVHADVLNDSNLVSLLHAPTVTMTLYQSLF
jgi:hypothetical protein